MKSNKFIKLVTGILLIIFILIPGSIFAEDFDSIEKEPLFGPTITVNFRLTGNKAGLFDSGNCWQAPAFGGYIMSSVFEVNIPEMAGKQINWQLEHDGIASMSPDNGTKTVGSNGKVSFNFNSPIFDSPNGTDSRTWILKIGGTEDNQIPEGTTFTVSHSNDGYFKPDNIEQSGTVGTPISYIDKYYGSYDPDNPEPEKEKEVKISFDLETRLVDKNLKSQEGNINALYTLKPIIYSGSKGTITLDQETVSANYTGSPVKQKINLTLTDYKKGTYGVNIKLNDNVSGVEYSGKKYSINFNFYVDDYGHYEKEDFSFINSDLPSKNDDSAIFYLLKKEDKPIQPTPTPEPSPNEPEEEEPSIDPPTIPVSGVSVRPTSLNLIAGNNSTLTASVSPNTATNKKVTWTSGNRNIATVDSKGKVTAIAAGSTIITATTEDGNKTASCNITVTSPVVHKDPEQITLTAYSIQMNVGNSYNIVATIQPADAQNKSITWSTSDSSIATVDNGTIIAKGPGTAKITAETVNGKTASCQITVNKPTETVKKVSTVTLDKSSNLLNIGDSFVLHQKVEPEDATNKNVTWSSSNENAVIVTGDGKVIAENPGISIITVASVDGNIKATCKVTVKEPENKNINVTGITLDQTNAILKTGESLTLNETVLPINATNKNITWHSTNDLVAHVDNYGIVKAISAGSAEIIVSTEDGQKTAKCTLTVKKMKKF